MEFDKVLKDARVEVLNEMTISKFAALYKAKDKRLMGDLGAGDTRIQSYIGSLRDEANKALSYDAAAEILLNKYGLSVQSDETLQKFVAQFATA